MSYWTVANGPGVDQPKSGSSVSVVLDALLAAKIPSEEAIRISQALSQAFASRSDLAVLAARALGEGKSLRPVSTAAVAAASTVAAKDAQDAVTGGPPIQVDSRLLVNNHLNVAGDIAVNNLRVFGNAEVGRQLRARAAAFKHLAVPNAVQADARAVVIDAPLVTNKPLISRQGGQHAGLHTFNGQVNLAGQVVWQGRACDPSVVVMAAGVAPNQDPVSGEYSSILSVVPKAVRVLNDHGEGRPTHLEFRWRPVAVSVLQGVVTESVNVVTSVGFDVEACALTSETTEIARIVDFTYQWVSTTQGTIEVRGGELPAGWGVPAT